MLKSIKRIFAVCTALTLIAASGCSPSKTVTIGISNNSLPMSGTNTDDETDGFIVEMAREAGKRMGMEVKLKYVDMSLGENNFHDKGVDALWGELTPNDNNSKFMYFTRSYIKNSQVFLVESASKIEKAEDLKGKKVGAVSNSVAFKSLSSSLIGAAVDGGKPVDFYEPISALMQLDDNKIDALALDETYANNLLTQHAEQYRILDMKLSPQKYAVAVRRNDSTLHDKFEAALDGMIKDGTAKNISVKWFGVDMISYS